MYVFTLRVNKNKIYLWKVKKIGIYTRHESSLLLIKKKRQKRE